LQPVPAGVLGELYLCGSGLARGYHRRPGLTAERFVASPFVAGARMYRTGDLARYRADGVLEYAGRLDHQVKLRGLRIELGEIEARLLEHPLVREAVVLAVEGKYLVGYVVLEQETADWRGELASHLGQRLPEYMVPSQWLALERMPLSPNGKLERKALPVFEAQAKEDYLEPQGELEQALAALWAQVLGVARVGRTDNFFELGGDSIISIQLVSRARQVGIGFSPRDLFQHQTVASLARIASTAAVEQAVQLPVEGALPLTPVQHAFFELAQFQRAHWNQSLLLQPRNALQAGALERALEHLLGQHDALRLSFVAQAEGWQQAYVAEPPAGLLWQRQVDSAQALLALCEEAQRSLSLEQGMLLRAVLAQLPDGSQRLLLVIHHLAVDGVSWRILLEDLQANYERCLLHKAPLAMSKTSSYKAWAERLLDNAATRTGECRWWQQHLAGAHESLPVRNAQGSLLNRHGRKQQLQLDAELTRQLLQEAPAAYRTQVNDLLLTALARVIRRWTGHDSTLIELEGHGREALFDDIDLSRTVGWFTSLFPLKLQASQSLSASIKSIKEQLRAVPDKGVGFGILRYLGDAQTRQVMAGLPRPRITFNYLGRFDSQFDEHAAFYPAAESAGHAQDENAPLANWLSIEGQVHGARLSLQWTYSEQMFDAATIEALLEDYRRELVALVAHCCEPANGGLTPSDVPLAALSQAELDALPGCPGDIQDLYPLSPMQQGMLFHSLYQADRGDYINQLRMDIQGLDSVRFREAWQHTVDAHDILRTTFLWHLEQPLQRVDKRAAVDFAEQDWRGQEDQQLRLDALALSERSRGFALDQAPLLRLLLVRLADDQYQLIYTHHHLLLDGWSNARVLAEVLQRYRTGTCATAAGRYQDYIAWLQRQDQEASKAFWHTQLAGLEVPTRLGRSIHPLPDSAAQGQDEHWQHLDEQASAALQAFARRCKVTLNTVIQGAWLVLLQRYSGQQCVAFGATVAGRPSDLPGVEEQVGLFINTLPVIAQVPGHLALGQWLQALQAQNLQLREHEHTPLFEIQRWAGQGDALFDTLLVFENYPVDQALSASALDGLHLSNIRSQEQTSLPLTLSVTAAQRLSLHYRFALASFTCEGVAGLSAQLAQLLDEMLNVGGEGHLGDLRLLPVAEQQRQISLWNPRQARQQPAQTIHGLIELQVARTPDAMALVHEHQALTYAELNVQANRLAHCLIARGVGPEVRVAIAMSRTPHMLIAMLAVLKAGGAYVPLDLDYPGERLAHMLEDSQAAWVLVDDTADVRELVLPEERLLPVAALLEDSASEDTDPCQAVSASNLAYVIYTSGSTGKPKGVAISHDNVRALIHWSARVYSQNDLQGVLASTSICFDLSVWELFVTLACGGHCILARNALALPDLPARDQVRLINTVPSAIAALEQAGHIPPSVRIINLAGEPLKQALVDALYRLPSLARVHDLYGPSEDTTYSTQALRAAGGEANIGRPVTNTAGYVLDAQLQPLPIGLNGELYLAGDGVTRGYLNRPGLTAERYVPDPFSADGLRMYRTGDLVRYDDKGVMHYTGRIDHQVKVRGFRIELGELEAQLLECPGVSAAVVVAQPLQGGVQLVAYLQEQPTAQDASTNQRREAVQAFLRQTLPDYMVPAHVLFLAQLPLTPNGKVDRKALPLPDAANGESHYSAPRTALQAAVALIWEQVLEQAPVGLGDNFFALGGHSLLATRVVSRIRRELSIEIALKTLFETSSLEAFVALLEQQAPSACTAIEPVSREQALPLSFAQERQWFLWQLAPHSAASNLPVTLRLRGELQVAALRESFARLLARHESLRTHVQVVQGQALQVIEPVSTLQLVLEQGADEAGVEALFAAEIERPFDLQAGPLLRIRLVRLAADDHALLLVQHHIVSDAWSMQLMVEELVEGYQACLEQRPLQLPQLPVQYADYAHWQRAWMAAGERERQLSYWRAQLGTLQPVLQLPLDHPRPVTPSHRGASLEFSLDNSLTQALEHCAREQGVTLFMLLLASFQVLLQRYSGQSDIRVGVPNANRNRAETERLIGFFVNTQVLKASLDGQLGFDQLLQQVKHTALQAQAHQDLPFEQLVEALQPERTLGQNPLFQVMFNHQSRTASAVRHLSGVQVEQRPFSGHAVQFDLTLDTLESADGLCATLSYMAELFEPRTIERMAGHWTQLLRAVVRQPQTCIGNLDLLDQQERDRQLLELNGPTRTYPFEQAVHQLIEAQAERAPQATALLFAGQRLDFASLNARANRLAHALIERGVGPDVLVGIALERSLDMVVGLLAIMKAGGAYVPLDPEYPQERLAYMLADSAVSLLLTQDSLRQRLPLDGIETLVPGDWLEVYSDRNPQVDLHPDNLAYVIYTSGSTGQPKGVAVAHGPLLMHCLAIGERYEMTAQDCELHFMSFAFDGAHERWLTSLSHGASLLIRDAALWTPEQTYQQMHQHGVTVAAFPPAYLQQLAEHAEREGNPPALRIYCFGGDAVPDASFELAKRALRPQYIINGYGPTETVVTPLIWKAGGDEGCGAAYAPIGERIGARSAYVLDSELNLVPQGIAGELYLGGQGLARGYLARAGLTAERFVADPFAPGGRLYRTGDLVRQRGDGVVEYLGRVDNQVKIRGFRIELGEIEACLLAVAGVREAVVLAREGLSGQQLVAYVVPTELTLLDDSQAQQALRDELRQHLRSVLPDYMVPAQWLLLAQLPLTPNGKLDRKALPAPDASALQGIYEAPVTALEQELANLWAQVLKLDRVGRNDNFFELGGHSLLAMQVIVGVREQLHVEIALKTLFSHPDLAGFAQQVEALRKENSPVQDALAKSLAALKRLSANDLEKLLSE
ncbi:amino acid adenylation domain-containing protein, partial [Pseudomonas sp.]|uniref:amino acid adenylation domain-containing protein n=1 Tax=Pseudomonas sp. TaxID=306 RepID=UPI003D6F56DC